MEGVLGGKPRLELAAPSIGQEVIDTSPDGTAEDLVLPAPWPGWKQQDMAQRERPV